MFGWFKKKVLIKEKTTGELLLEQYHSIAGEIVPLTDQYKSITIRGIMVTYEEGNFSDKMAMPDGMLFDLRRKLNNVGVLVESNWYEHEWIFNSTVDTIRIDYSDMEELYIPDTVEVFKRAINHAHINGQTELVIYGSPVLINTLLPFINTLEVYSSKLNPIEPTVYSSFARLVNTNADVTDTFALGGYNFVVTKKFEINSFKYYNLVNLKPLEIKNGE